MASQFSDNVSICEKKPNTKTKGIINRWVSNYVLIIVISALNLHILSS